MIALESRFGLIVALLVLPGSPCGVADEVGDEVRDGLDNH